MPGLSFNAPHGSVHANLTINASCSNIPQFKGVTCRAHLAVQGESGDEVDECSTNSCKHVVEHEVPKLLGHNVISDMLKVGADVVCRTIFLHVEPEEFNV